MSATQRFPPESKARPSGYIIPLAVVAVALVVKLDCPRTNDAASPVLNGAAYSRTLLLVVSTTQRLPEESKATAPGFPSPVAVVENALVVKLDWPKTSVAASPVVKGAAYSMTLLLRLSANQRFPEASKPSPVGTSSFVADVPEVPIVKLDCPRTNVAASPVMKGAVYSRTLWLPVSDTQRFPEASKARPVGDHSPVAVVASVLEVKLDCPRTSAAASPVVNGAVNSSVRLLFESATQRFPSESKASPRGSERFLAEAALMPVMKLD